MADTGWKSPSANGKVHSNWWEPTRAYTSDNSGAREAQDGDHHDYYEFSFAVPPSAIDGIEVSLEGREGQGGGALCYFNVSLSWDGGTNWTATKRLPTTGEYDDDPDQTHTAGGAADNWGRAWAAAELDDANFVAAFEYKEIGVAQARVDHIQVKVHYTVKPRRIFITHQ